MPDFLQSLDSQEEPVRRMNQILDGSQKVRQAFADCQDAVCKGDYERLKAKLQSDSELASLDGYLGHLVKQISAEVQRLELLHAAEGAE